MGTGQLRGPLSGGIMNGQVERIPSSGSTEPFLIERPPLMTERAGSGV